MSTILRGNRSILICSKCGTDLKMTMKEAQEAEQIDCYGCGETLKSRVDPPTAQIIVAERHVLVCEHGQLQRQCNECSQEAELSEARERIAELETRLTVVRNQRDAAIKQDIGHVTILRDLREQLNKLTEETRRLRDGG